jgi:hypothetical protein
MDDRRLKRLVAMTVMAIIFIMFFKYVLTRAITNVGNAALAKRHATAVQAAPVPAPIVPAVSGPAGTADAAASQGQ